MQRKVKWCSGERGYGFLIADDGSGDVFLHASASKRSGLAESQLERDTRVDYEISPDRRIGRPQVHIVKLIVDDPDVTRPRREVDVAWAARSSDLPRGRDL